jgi:hypothetical protein
MKVIKYKTGEEIPNLHKEVEKVWWDHLAEDPNYQVTLYNTDVFKNPNLRNAYAYEVMDGKVYFSIITEAQFKKDLHEFYEQNILHKNVYDFTLIDKYTYHVNSYPYYFQKNDNFIDAVNVALEQVDRFKEYPATNPVNIDELENLVKRCCDYFNADYLYEYFKTNQNEIYSYQSFAQGNCQVKRLLTDGENLFFDYFSIYEIAEFRSYLIDVANMLVSLLVEDNSIQAKIFVVNTLKKYPKDIVLFWILLQEECQGETRKFFEALWNKQ